MLTDIVIQDMVSDKKVRLKCKELIKKVSVYKKTLAIQLQDKVLIYQEVENRNYNIQMNYQIHKVIKHKITCHLMVVTSHHLTTCNER